MFVEDAQGTVGGSGEGDEGGDVLPLKGRERIPKKRFGKKQRTKRTRKRTVVVTLDGYPYTGLGGI
jgi:hypothetical protein